MIVNTMPVGMIATSPPKKPEATPESQAHIPSNRSI